MELVGLAKDVLQNIAETMASYRFGQSILRHLDRTLWVVEKCARWAVPPPLDEDDRPQPELVRPLPWVFFLALIVVLRISRESISLINLLMGKPPLRSADVVMFLQSRRRYLRTLKYQGNRIMRARTSEAYGRQSWWNALQSLFDFTMCFRRHSPRYRNNNTTRISNNDEILVVKRHKRVRQDTGNVAPGNETSMERLIEKMMVDLDAESDEDASFTLTNATSPKSDRSDFTQDSDQDTAFYNNTSDISNESENNASDQKADLSEVPSSKSSSPQEEASSQTENNNPSSENTICPVEKANSTPEKTSSASEKTNFSPGKASSTPDKTLSPPEKNNTSEKTSYSPEKPNSPPEKTNSPPGKTNSPTMKTNYPQENPISKTNDVNHTPPKTKNKDDSMKSEDTSSKMPRSPKNEQKIANGRTVNSASNKNKGSMKENDSRRSTSHTSKNA